MKRFGKKGAAVIVVMFIVLAVAAAIGSVYACNVETLQKKEEVAQEEGGKVCSSKDAVLELETGAQQKKVPAGDRTKMIRLAIVEGGIPVFEIRKEPSENQEDFEEWYVTEPYSYKQLVNVSDLYSFLDHYAGWNYIDQTTNVVFEDSGIFVEEEFSDTGVAKFIIGQKNESGNYYVKADYSGKIYEVEAKQVEAMTGLRPEDFMMGIASLVYLTTVEKLEIWTEETEAAFDIETDSANNQAYMREGTTEDEKEFKKMYSAILSIVIAKEAETRKIQEEPVLKLKFYRNTDRLSDTEICYYPYDGAYYLIGKDGKQQFLADKKAVDRLIDLIDQFCRR